MKSLRNNTPPAAHKIIVFIAVAIIIASLVTAGMFFGQVGPFSKNEANNPNSTQTTDTNKTTTPPIGTDKTPVNNQPTDNKTQNKTVGASITYIQPSNTNLRIGTNIESITSSGSCTITLTKGSLVVTRTVDIQALSSSSTCKGFDIPIIELPSGTWNIKIDILLTSQEAHLTDSVKID